MGFSLCYLISSEESLRCFITFVFVFIDEISGRKPMSSNLLLSNSQIAITVPNNWSWVKIPDLADNRLCWRWQRFRILAMTWSCLLGGWDGWRMLLWEAESTNMSPIAIHTLPRWFVRYSAVRLPLHPPLGFCMQIYAQFMRRYLINMRQSHWP